MPATAGTVSGQPHVAEHVRAFSTSLTKRPWNVSVPAVAFSRSAPLPIAVSLCRPLYRTDRVFGASSSIVVKRYAPPSTRNDGGDKIMSPTSYQAAPPRITFRQLAYTSDAGFGRCTGFGPDARSGGKVARSADARQARSG